MTDPSNEELERRFAEHGISVWKLYPWWYRLCRRAGINVNPPVLFTLADHFKVEGSWALLFFIVAVLSTDPFDPVVAFTPLFLLIFIVPLFNWWYYRRIRRRIGA